MRFSVLGPLQVLDDEGSTIDLGGRQPRLMIAMLLVADGRSVSVDSLTDVLWGDEPPASAMGTLHSNVSRLRRRLGSETLVLDDYGYRLRVDPADVDHLRFGRLADEGRAALDAGDARTAHARLVEAESLWRGPALVEFPDAEFATNAAARLEERRLAVVEDRLDADLALGHQASVVSELQGLVGRFPLRERFRAQLALALYRSGRQAEALRSLADAATTLREELGIEPGRALRDLESAILDHDRALDLPASPPVPSRRAAAAAPTPGRARAARDRSGPRSPRPTSAAARPSSPPCSTPSPTPAVTPSSSSSRASPASARPASPRSCAAASPPTATRVRSRSGVGATRAAPHRRCGRGSPRSASSPMHGVEIPPALVQLLTGEVAMEPGQAQAAQFQRFDAFAAPARGRRARPARGRPARRPPVGRRRVARAARLPRRPPAAWRADRRHGPPARGRPQRRRHRGPRRDRPSTRQPAPRAPRPRRVGHRAGAPGRRRRRARSGPGRADPPPGRGQPVLRDRAGSTPRRGRSGVGGAGHGARRHPSSDAATGRTDRRPARRSPRWSAATSISSSSPMPPASIRPRAST